MVTLLIGRQSVILTSGTPQLTEWSLAVCTFTHTTPEDEM